MALPWLDSMQPALSAETKQPKRFVGVLNYFSFHTPFLFPKDSGYDYQLSPYLELLRDHKQDFTILSGLNHPDVRDGHASDKSFFTDVSQYDLHRPTCCGSHWSRDSLLVAQLLDQCFL
jgi:hypothetical protein